MRRLGQHFLKNKAAIKKIVAALDLQENEIVIEVGPGHGELTTELLKYPIRLIAVEKDRVLAEELARKFSIFKDQFSIKEDDILKFLPNLKIENCKFKIVGSIPYYITGHLFRIIGELDNKPIVSVFTIQKEVGGRLTATPPKMNRLAASVQIWSDVEIVAKIPAQDFDPPPKVDSAVIRLKTKADFIVHDREFYSKYYNCVRILFQQPRKTILNNLLAGFNISKEKLGSKLQELAINDKDRPQNLSIDQITKIAQRLSTT